MKKHITGFIFLLIMSVILLLLLNNRKTNLYIVIQDIKGYSYTFNDSIIQNINNLMIRQDGEFSHQRWEVEIDSSQIRKVALADYMTNVTCSPYFIIKNFGINRRIVKDLDQFDIFLIISEDKETYILPVKNINFIID